MYNNASHYFKFSYEENFNFIRMKNAVDFVREENLAIDFCGKPNAFAKTRDIQLELKIRRNLKCNTDF